MKLRVSANPLRFAFVLCFTWTLASSAAPAIKNMALVVSAGSKLSDVPLADLTKFCKGAQKAWPDGKNFTLVMKDPESPDLRVVVQASKDLVVSVGDHDGSQGQAHDEKGQRL